MDRAKATVGEWCMASYDYDVIFSLIYCKLRLELFQEENVTLIVTALMVCELRGFVLFELSQLLTIALQ